MSGSSRAGRTLSRCVVTMDAGISISWAPDENGSIEHGMERHRSEEARFRERIDAATPAIEVVLDELESGGHTFLSPTDPTFEQHAQRSTTGVMPLVEVALACTPQLDDVALKALTQRVSTLISTSPEPPPPETEPEVVPEETLPSKPWWKRW